MSMLKNKTFFLSIILIVILSGIIYLLFPSSVETKSENRTPTSTSETLTWTGCGISKQAFMIEMAKAYKEDTDIAINLSGGGATKGIHDVSAGKTDLGGTCRHRLTTSTGSVQQAAVNAKLTHVAWDALVPIVHPENDVYKISMKQLKQIYNGEISNWADLGGDNADILLFTRGRKDSGVGHMFRLLVFNNPAYDFKAKSLSLPSSGPLERKIETEKYGLGVTGISSARKRRVKPLIIDDVSASKRNIAAGKYPLFRPLYLVSNINASTNVQHFIDYILSQKGQQIIDSNSGVNLKKGRALIKVWRTKMNTKIADGSLSRLNGGISSGIEPPPLIVKKPVEAISPVKPTTPKLTTKTILTVSIPAGQGYSYATKKLIKNEPKTAQNTVLPRDIIQAGKKLEQLFNNRVLWPDDTISIKRRENTYILQLIRDDKVEEEVTHTI